MRRHRPAHLPEHDLCASPWSPCFPRAALGAVALWAAASVVVMVAAGCASSPYRFDTVRRDCRSDRLAADDEPQVVRGRPHAALDGVGWVVGIPNKILLWNRRMENHRVSPKTEAAIAEYLETNRLDVVKVRLNQYDPLDDWRRLTRNTAVGAGWRYTLGTLSCVGETLLPGRVFGGDHYNPFTETIHIYSDIPAVAVHEGGHAKDFAARKYKGTYAAAYLLPVAPLWHEALATEDAIGWFRAEGRLDDELEAYRVLYPAYGTYVGNAAGTFAPGGSTPLYLTGVVGGHVVGRLKARRVEREFREDADVVARKEEHRPRTRLADESHPDR